MLLAPLLIGLCALQVPEPPDAAADVWQAPPTCPDRTALMQAIERRLGRALTDGEVRFAGTISQRASGPRFSLRLELSVGGRAQTRTLTATRCASLVDATALLVVLALREQQAAVVPEATPETFEDPGPEDSTPEVMEADAPTVTDASDASAAIDVAERLDLPDLDEPAALPAPAASRRRRGALVRVHGGLEYGALPGVTGAVGVVTGVLWPRARLELHGSYLAPRTETLAMHSLRVALFTGAALGCGRLGRGALEVPLCGGLELGGVASAATGPGARSGVDVWLAGVATAGVAWHLARRWSVTAALHGLVHLYGPRFELRDPGPPAALFRPAPVSGRLLFGLELRLGDPW